MGYLAPGNFLENMLQLMRFNEGIPNKNNGYFNIEIMISAAHMVGAV